MTWDRRTARREPRGREPYLLQSSIARSDDRLGSIRDLQLAENIGNMVADGLGAEHELFSNGHVGITLRHEHQNLAFALGQIGKRLRRCVWSWRPEVLHQPTSDRRAKDG